VIVVPGEGGDRITWSLAPEGKLRVEIAARRWRERRAPLILVSGGYVHPNQTPFSEAVEMKKSLMADFGVPEDAILIRSARSAYDNQFTECGPRNVSIWSAVRSSGADYDG